jgi:hypothetical protein
MIQDNFDELQRIVQTVVPFVILFIWIVIALFNNARKKSEQEMGQAKTNREKSGWKSKPSSPAEQTQRKLDKRGGGSFNQARRSLETVFEEMNRKVDKRWEDARKKVEESKNASKTSNLEEKMALFEKKKQDTRNAIESVGSAVELETENEYDPYEIENRKIRQALLGRNRREALRNGIIWFEILSPPKAMRE